MHKTSPRPARALMGARPHHARILLLMAPAATPSPAPAVHGIATPDAWPAASDAIAESALAWLNANAILLLAILIWSLFAAIVLYVVLQCALRLAGRSSWF